MPEHIPKSQGVLKVPFSGILRGSIAGGLQIIKEILSREVRATLCFEKRGGKHQVKLPRNCYFSLKVHSIYILALKHLHLFFMYIDYDIDSLAQSLGAG